MSETEAVHVTLEPFFLNQSRHKTYQDCARLYAWQHIANLEPDRPRKVLEIGSAIHKAMVAANIGGGTQAAFTSATDLAEAEFRKGMQCLGPQLPGDEAELLDGVGTIRKLLPAYYAHWRALGQLWKPLGQELAFCVEVGEDTNVFLVGTMDNLVTYMGNLWLADYKTMGRLDMRDFLKYEIDVQLTAYIYGGTKQLSLQAKAEGRPPVIIRGAIIDGMVKTDIPQFHREIFTRSVEDLREFELEFCMSAWELAAKHAIVRQDRTAYNAYHERMYDLGTSAGWKVVFSKSTQQCFRYSTCAFRDLCVKDTETRRLAFRTRRPDYVDAAKLKSEGNAN